VRGGGSLSCMHRCLPVEGLRLFTVQQRAVIGMAETKKRKTAAGKAKASTAGRKAKKPVISRRDAEQIARAYLADKGAFSISGVADGAPEGFEAYFAANETLAAALRDCWVVECGLAPFLVVDGGTMLIGVSKATGDIVYAGILQVA